MPSPHGRSPRKYKRARIGPRSPGMLSSRVSTAGAGAAALALGSLRCRRNSAPRRYRAAGRHAKSVTRINPATTTHCSRSLRMTQSLTRDFHAWSAVRQSLTTNYQSAPNVSKPSGLWCSALVSLFRIEQTDLRVVHHRSVLRIFDHDAVVVRQLDVERGRNVGHRSDALVLAGQAQAHRVGVLLTRHELNLVPLEQVALVSVERDPPILTRAVLDETHGFHRDFAAFFGYAFARLRGILVLALTLLFGRCPDLGPREVEHVDHVVSG